MSKNVYHVGSGELTFEIIERIINENLKLELAPEAKLRIQKCRDYLDCKIASSEEPPVWHNNRFRFFMYQEHLFRRAGYTPRKPDKESCLQRRRRNPPGHYQTDVVVESSRPLSRT